MSKRRKCEYNMTVFPDDIWSEILSFIGDGKTVINLSLAVKDVYQFNLRTGWKFTNNATYYGSFSINSLPAKTFEHIKNLRVTEFDINISYEHIKEIFPNAIVEYICKFCKRVIITNVHLDCTGLLFYVCDKSPVCYACQKRNQLEVLSKCEVCEKYIAEEKDNPEDVCWNCIIMLNGKDYYKDYPLPINIKKQY